MIKYLNNNITNIDSGVIVHGVNCQGAMGSGVAKAIKDKWPVVYTEYMSLFPDGVARPNLLGKSQFIKISNRQFRRFEGNNEEQVVNLDDLYIFNAFTQEKYGRDGSVYADVHAIKSALENVIITMTMLDIDSPINMPMIGSGLGGLDWHNDVVPVLEELSKTHDVLFTVHFIDK